MADTLGVHNPLRYRGYVYDQETGLYYLRSRYYDPNMGRFINGDVFVSTGQGLLGNNMFAYCLNNPVFYVDLSGESVLVAIGIGLIFTGLLFIPSSSSQTVAENNTAYSSGDVPYKGTPGSHVISPDGTKERIYGENGLPAKDRHHTNHGNPKEHPDVPHDHDWGYNEQGKWEPGPGYKSPDGPLTLSDDIAQPEFSFNFSISSLYIPNTGDLSFWEFFLVILELK